jgi:hypothetical protein
MDSEPTPQVGPGQSKMGSVLNGTIYATARHNGYLDSRERN